MEGSKDEAIFKAISDLIVQQDFIEAEFAFFEKNKDTFEDTEENKLEHMEIYKTYIMILEEIIEAKLKDTFQDQEISAFYETFPANLEAYEKISEATVDKLFGFKDFDKFKAKIVEYKKGFKEPTKDDVEEKVDKSVVSQDSEAIKNFFFDLFKEDISDKALKWSKTAEVKGEDGVKCIVHQRPIPGKSLKLCRQETIFDNISLATGFEFFSNFRVHAQSPEYGDPKTGESMKGITVVEENDDRTFQIMYSKSMFGPLATPRESLVQSNTFKLDDGKLLMIARSIERDDYPVTAECVRLEYFRAQMMMQEGDNLKCVGFSSIDFKGYFPSMLLNMIMSSMITSGKKNGYKKLKHLQETLKL